MKHDTLFGYLIPLWIFVLTIIVVGAEFYFNTSGPRSELPHGWTRVMLICLIVGGAGHFMAVLVYMPYALEINDASSMLILIQTLLWAVLAITVYSIIQDRQYSLDAPYREFVWFGGRASVPFDCCFFGAFFVPSWFIMAISGVLFWRHLSGTVKVANVLYLSMFLMLLMTYIFPPSP